MPSTLSASDALLLKVLLAAQLTSCLLQQPGRTDASKAVPLAAGCLHPELCHPQEKERQLKAAEAKKAAKARAAAANRKVAAAAPAAAAAAAASAAAAAPAAGQPLPRSGVVQVPTLPQSLDFASSFHACLGTSHYH